jgi:hypothetical protein
MLEQKLDHQLTKALLIVIAAILILIPFHAILTVWLSRLIGHYTILRLWKECLLIPLGLGAVLLLFKQAQLRQRIIHSKLAWLITAFLLVQLVWGLVAYLTHQVSLKALGYGLVSNCRYFVFFGIVWVIAASYPRLQAHWAKLVFWPAAIVIAFGLLQYFILPYNFLTHFGYSSATIFPYEDINSNIHFLRIMSTLRGADPLGAYLLVVLSLALAYWQKKKQWWLVPLAATGLLALIFSFSRAAWIGLVLSVALLLWVSLKNQKVRKIAFVGAAVIIVVAGGTALAFRHNTTFQNIFLHTQTNSAVATNSNQGHASALASGLHDLIHDPLGHGPGTAGPASVYNTKAQARIAENYFIQIGQETGWIGLFLFLAINIAVGMKLWQRRDHALAIGLLAALIGISFVGLLSHVWADDTLAYLWWGLAAIACVI